MKTLKSSYHGGDWARSEVVTLPISSLWASVHKAEKLRGKDFYGPVLEDIRENGLKFPLIIVEATAEQLIKQKERYKDQLCDLPIKEGDAEDKIYLCVWGGSNRIRIAEELGFDHIDCVIIPDGNFILAQKKQSLHRLPYLRKYYT